MPIVVYLEVCVNIDNEVIPVYHKRQHIKDLRFSAPPSDVRILDSNGKLIRTEAPTYWEDRVIYSRGVPVAPH